jgi:CHAT domain-containing protein
MLFALAGPAAAEYFTFQGELQFQPSGDPFCAALSVGTFHVAVMGRNDGPLRGIEAYLYGEQIIHAHIRGGNPGNLSLTYIGESGTSHTMRLRSAGPGAYVGELQGESLLGALYGCGFTNAEIRLTKSAGGNDQAAFQNAEGQFQLDNHAFQGVLLARQGKVREAIPTVQQALAEKQKSYAADHPQLLPYYFYLAQIYLAEGSIPAAIPLDRAALAVCNQFYGPESACAGVMLSNLGLALTDDGIYDEAESTLRRALAICDKYFGPQSPIRGTVLNPLSAVLMYTGRYGEAESALTEALALNKRWPNPDNENVGISLNNFGALYYLTGQYRKAETALRQAVAIDTKAAGADSPLTIINMISLAHVLRVSDQYAAAEPVARHALAAAEKVLGPERQDHPALGMAQVCLAELLRVTGRYGEAEPLYRQALANGTKYLGPDNPNVAAAGLLLAKLLHATGRDQEALGLLSHANVVAHLSGNQMIAWQVAGELMEVYSTGQFENRFKAVFYGKEAVNDLQKLRGNLANSSSETQQAFVSSAEVAAIYRKLAGLLISDGRTSEAQQVLAMVKEQEFYEFTQRAAPADAPKTVAALSPSEKQLDDLNSKYVSLGQEYGALKEKLRKQGDNLSAADQARLTKLREQMDAAQTAFDARVAEIAKGANDPEARKRRATEMNDYSRAFQGTLKDMGHEAVVVQYIVQDDEVDMIFATPNAVVSRSSKIKQQDLYRQIHDFRKALANPHEDPLPGAQALYRLLVGPIAEDLRQAGAKTLMLDLDGALRYVPFAALHDGKNYLIENLSIVMVTEAVRDKLGARPRPDWSVWGLGITKAGPGYDALPYADVELNGIAGQGGILDGKVMLDTAFTENSLRNGLDRSVPIIHIASHFQFTPGSMDDSFLLLGDGTHLTLAEIKNKLNFNSVELLTLSACETAVGDDSASGSGTEVEGLGAIAQQAGAKAVLATLWPVADASTATLMRAMYQAHKVDHLDKADALRQAQLVLLRGSTKVDDSDKARRGLTRIESARAPGNFRADPSAPYAHPFFWAPFILMGNWL